ncbi:PREDICTED: protein TPX2-like [Ipomoea nil]|uniref:protein TPX2-like n=1 Tax=Ipomoea nil TaxID=35883 RepID=UPI0009019731|nr:PREDICTED: protein TPX2-like [Ipomoea nil]
MLRSTRQLKKIASMIRNPSALKSATQSQVKSINPASAIRNANIKITSEAPNFAQEIQAIKRQKLEEGKARESGYVDQRLLNINAKWNVLYRFPELLLEWMFPMAFSGIHSFHTDSITSLSQEFII